MGLLVSVRKEVGKIIIYFVNLQILKYQNFQHCMKSMSPQIIRVEPKVLNENLPTIPFSTSKILFFFNNLKAIRYENQVAKKSSS